MATEEENGTFHSYVYFILSFLLHKSLLLGRDQSQRLGNVSFLLLYLPIPLRISLVADLGLYYSIASFSRVVGTAFKGGMVVRWSKS